MARIGDVAGRVAGNVEHLEVEPEPGDLGTVSCGERPDAGRHALARGAESAGTGRGHERRHAADVVGVVMRREDRREREAFALEHGEYRRGIARIDDGDGARIGAAADHPDVIVAKRRDRPHVEHARV